MPIEIKHRYTGTVLRTVDADTLRGAYLRGANLNGADLRGANLTGADLRRANLTGANLSRADLSGADLDGAGLSGADLSGVGLSGTYLTGAGLSGTYLTGAGLRGAGLRGAMIGDDKIDRLLGRATRSDGHEFFLFELQGGPPKIKAGCRWMTIAEYRAHVVKEYPDTDKGRETLDILTFFEARSR